MLQTEVAANLIDTVLYNHKSSHIKLLVESSVAETVDFDVLNFF